MLDFFADDRHVVLEFGYICQAYRCKVARVFALLSLLLYVVILCNTSHFDHPPFLLEEYGTTIHD
jgi:hypothetical protein